MKPKLSRVQVAGIIAGIVVIAVAWVVYYEVFRIRYLPETDLFSLGQVYTNKGDYKKGIEYFEMLLKKDPRHTVAMEFLIDAQKKAGDIKGAIATMERLAEVAPTPMRWKELLDVYRSAGMEGKAKAIESQSKILFDPANYGNSLSEKDRVPEEDLKRIRGAVTDSHPATPNKAGKGHAKPAARPAHNKK